MSYSELTTKKAKQEYIRKMVSTNANWAIRALLRIYQNQTEDEQYSHTTCHQNGIGFSGCDAEILTSFAQQVNRGRALSEKQMNLLFKKMPRYSRQLMEATQ